VKRATLVRAAVAVLDGRIWVIVVNEAFTP
jgi:hypothetical protein